ncbi:D-lactate dehydrogenase [Kwoniella heveanensis BCC8398]|uniref:D-lactate dehydrogenase n=1 Tax=Kwoniella heveanensis BCC8398 TaxID=1296120 RepID=A0A1B9GWH5_9TREE|nr:D-lactate dehydrogenase [Kwoniella heveanensis BCC8398]
MCQGESAQSTTSLCQCSSFGVRLSETPGAGPSGRRHPTSRTGLSRRPVAADRSIIGRAPQILHRYTTASLHSARHPSYPYQRNGKYTILTTSHVKELRSLLPHPTSILTTLDLEDPATATSTATATEDDLAFYNIDWMGKYKGRSQVVVRPRSTEEVAKVVRWCHGNDVAIVPQGGNTGLVGGSTPIHDELILSLSHLTAIRSFDSLSGVLTVEAGAILETVDSFLSNQAPEPGFIFPLDLGAKGSCQVGGNAATNAGGLRLLRYGSLRGSVLGLEVVLPDGRVWEGLSGLRKDNTGYDMKQLFIGSEGSIGIITAISILCPRRSSSTNVALFALPTYDACLEVFSQTKKHLGEILSAFEMFDKASYDAVKAHGGIKGRNVFEEQAQKEARFFCLVETSGSNAEHDAEKLSNLFESLLSASLILDGALAQDASQSAEIWKIRELCPESLSKSGKAYKYDLSVPVEKMYTLVERMRDHLRGNERIKGVAGFGHMGDGNLHLNVLATEFSDDIQRSIEPLIYQLVSEYDGSISAEHGLGAMKAPYISFSQSTNSIELMRRIKEIFDPKGIMNPYKFVLPRRDE